jgi:hypothetical protein
MMMAVGGIQSQRCNTNQCPVGVATQEPKRSRALDVPDKTERVHRYQHAAVAEATRLIASMGLHSPSEVTPHHLVRRAQPGRRRDPPRGPPGVDRGPPRGNRRLRGRRAGQVTGTLGVCMGTVGPGSLHLLNGSDFFQEVNNDALFADVAVFCRTLSSSGQLPGLLEQAVQRALDAPGVALLTLPGDVGGLEAEGAAPHFVTQRRPNRARPRRSAGGRRADRRRRRGHAAGRPRRPPCARRGAGAGRSPGRPDGPDPQGQGGAGARQPVRRGTERADRQPGRPARLRVLRPAAHARHRLPLPTGIPRAST